MLIFAPADHLSTVELDGNCWQNHLNQLRVEWVICGRTTVWSHDLHALPLPSKGKVLQSLHFASRRWIGSRSKEHRSSQVISLQRFVLWLFWCSNFDLARCFLDRTDEMRRKQCYCSLLFQPLVNLRLHLYVLS